MSTHQIVASVLGLAAEASCRREFAALDATLATFGEAEWSARTPSGSALDAVAHLAAGAQRLGDALARHRDPAEASGPLQHPIHDPAAADGDGAATGDEARVAYRGATAMLLAGLGACRTEDWSWPVWSPLGGTETLASAVRRLLAHHRVHHLDIARAAGRAAEHDEETAVLTSEFVLDAAARRGGAEVPAPMLLEVVVDPPGAGTWSLVFDAPPAREDLPPLWQELLSREEALDVHRLERGSSGAARAVVRVDGDTLWRAAFNRGASWADVEVHGDDDGREAWRTLVRAISDGQPAGVRRVQT